MEHAYHCDQSVHISCDCGVHFCLCWQFDKFGAVFFFRQQGISSRASDPWMFLKGVKLRSLPTESAPTRSLSILIRLMGFFSSSCFMRSSKSSPNPFSRFTSSSTIALYSSNTALFSKGTRPNRRQYRVTPIPQISAALPDMSPRLRTQSSGAMNAGEPDDFCTLSDSFWNISDTPKSTTFSVSSSVNKQLSGLRSRCTTPCAWTVDVRDGGVFPLQKAYGIL